MNHTRKHTVGKPVKVNGVWQVTCRCSLVQAHPAYIGALNMGQQHALNEYLAARRASAQAELDQAIAINSADRCTHVSPAGADAHRYPATTCHAVLQNGSCPMGHGTGADQA